MCYKTQAINRNMFFSLYIYKKREGMSEIIEMEKRERERDRTREICFFEISKYKDEEAFYRLLICLHLCTHKCE